MIIFRGRADVVRLIEIIRAQMRKKRLKALFLYWWVVQD